MSYDAEPAANRSAPSECAEPAGVSSQAWITLLITTAIYTVNVADRFVFPTLLQSIKAEFSLSDTSVASLNLARGLVLMLFGVPAGMLADRFSRRHLLSISAIIFSAMTALSSLSTSLTSFVVARMGLGLGESGCTPTSLTLIADRFPVSRRGVAMTIFTLGVSAGSFCGTAVTGSLCDLYGWRTTILIFGLGGLPLGLLANFLIKEPARGKMDAMVAKIDANGGGLSATLIHIWRDKALLSIILGGSICCTWGWGLLWWTPAFLTRTYGLTNGDAGTLLGKLHLIGGAAATIFAAFVIHWLSGRPVRVQILSIAGIVTLATAASMVAYTTKDLFVLTWCLWLFVPVLYMTTGPTFNLINNMAPTDIRATTVALFLLATSVGNFILAPMVIGYLSDLLVAAGQESLRHAMAMFAPLGLAGALAYFAAGIASRERKARNFDQL
ncbi:MAG: MFS transporter [Massilia sp.]